MKNLVLQPGDCLLYKPKGFFGWMIAAKTWHQIAHVEVYIGGDCSVASRDGKGVGLYPTRYEGLVQVCRPRLPVKLDEAMAWFVKYADGLPYGWADLLQFGGYNVDGRGMICSTFATLFLRAGGFEPFNELEPATKIAPFQFATSPAFAVLAYE